MKKIRINNTTFQIEIADDDSSRVLGLSNRKSMPTDQGMLFVYNIPSFHTFWMKQMYFPLDFVWINGDTVVDITKNVPPPSNIDETNLPFVSPGKPADKVLELNAGMIDKTNIKINDKIYLE